MTLSKIHEHLILRSLAEMTTTSRWELHVRVTPCGIIVNSEYKQRKQGK